MAGGALGLAALVLVWVILMSYGWVGFQRRGTRAREHLPWLLLPIILTTVFVIFGAWRSAVKAGDAVGQIPEESE